MWIKNLVGKWEEEQTRQHFESEDRGFQKKFSLRGLFGIRRGKKRAVDMELVPTERVLGPSCTDRK